MRRSKPRAIAIPRQPANVHTAGTIGTIGLIATLMLFWWLTLIL